MQILLHSSFLVAPSLAPQPIMQCNVAYNTPYNFPNFPKLFLAINGVSKKFVNVAFMNNKL
jgi:hypothetical protein